MVLETKPLTVEEFDALVQLPENADKAFEYIAGRYVESLPWSTVSEIGAAILMRIYEFVHPRRLGRLTGADGGYAIGTERYIPNVAFVSMHRQPKSSKAYFNPLAPDLAVEISSPSDSPTDVRFKLMNYLHVGTVVWIVEPALKRVEVYVPGEAPKVLGVKDTLSGEPVLPGFSLPVSEIFAVAE